MPPGCKEKSNEQKADPALPDRRQKAGIFERAPPPGRYLVRWGQRLRPVVRACSAAPGGRRLWCTPRWAAGRGSGPRSTFRSRDLLCRICLLPLSCELLS